MSQDQPARPRAPRISAEETSRRMLDAGLAMVTEEGLRVDFSLMSLEDVIVRAKVARAAAYRRWPSRDAYFHDLLVELAGRLRTPVYQLNVLPRLVHGMAWETRLRSREGRWALWVELTRVGAVATQETMTTSPEYATRMVLSATVRNLTDGELRDRLVATLAESEQAQRREIERFYAAVVELLGLQPRTDGMAPTDIAEVCAAYLIGYATVEPINPDVWRRPLPADPFGTGDERTWHLPEYGFTTLMTSLVRLVDQDTYDATTQGRAWQRFCDALDLG